VLASLVSCVQYFAAVVACAIAVGVVVDACIATVDWLDERSRRFRLVRRK
jgi:hypothetical protein